MRYSDLVGLLGTSLRFGIGGLLFKSIAGKFRARNAADDADVPLVGSVVASSGDEIQINEGAAGAGADWTYRIFRPATGMTEEISLTLPPNFGTNGYALVTDGAGNLTWASNAAATNLEATDTTLLEFDSTSPVAMFTLPADAAVAKIQIPIDTEFDGTASFSIGIAGETTKYLGSTTIAGLPAGTVIEVGPGLLPEVATEDLIITYSAGGATVGSARVLVSYVIPS